MLPIICVGIGKLIEFARGLIRDIVHALIVADHAVLLETNTHELRIVWIKLSYNLEGRVTHDGSSLVGVNNEATS